MDAATFYAMDHRDPNPDSTDEFTCETYVKAGGNLDRLRVDAGTHGDHELVDIIRAHLGERTPAEQAFYDKHGYDEGHELFCSRCDSPLDDLARHHLDEGGPDQCGCGLTIHPLPDEWLAKNGYEADESDGECRGCGTALRPGYAYCNECDGN